MAPVSITEDYYNILEVTQDASIEVIRESYKRLALKRHPDRNPGRNTTAAFQLLQRAYETLKDDTERRVYDIIYPSIAAKRRAQPTASQPSNSHSPNAAPEVQNEAAEISVIEQRKEKRQSEWRIKKVVFDSAIYELQRTIRRVEKELQELNNIIAADVAEQEWKRSWGAWLLSPVYRKAKLSDEEKETKDRQRQERMIQRDMKERRLTSTREACKRQELQLDSAKKETERADIADDKKIRALQDRIRYRDEMAREAKERARREEQQRVWKQQQEQREKRDREEAERQRKQQAEERAAAQKRYDEALERSKRLKAEALERVRKLQAEAAERSRKSQKDAKEAERKRQDENRARHPHLDHFDHFDYSRGTTAANTCIHEGWWDKIQGRKACPKCLVVWTYLLECPGCKMKACPKCQAGVRPRQRGRRPNLKTHGSYVPTFDDWD